MKLLPLGIALIAIFVTSNAIAKEDPYDKRILRMCTDKQFNDAKHRDMPITKAQASSFCSCSMAAQKRLNKQDPDDEQFLTKFNQEVLSCAAKNGINVTPMI